VPPNISILSGCITAWYGNCSAQDRKKLAQDRKKLQKVVCTAQTITKASLPSLESIYTARCRRKATNIGTYHTLVTIYSNLSHRAEDTEA